MSTSRAGGTTTRCDYASVAKLIRHPLVGDLGFDIEIVSPPRDPDQHLIVYTAEPGPPTAGMLPLLAGWQHLSHVTPTRRDAARSGANRDPGRDGQGDPR